MIRIYIDMDGVLARFDKEENALERFANEKGFFSKLEITEFGKRIAKIRNTERFFILSASPNEVADGDKKQWLRNNLDNIKEENIIFVRSGKEKAEFANKESILIDDFTENLVEFENKGGKVIKAKNFLNCKKGKSENMKKVVVF